MVLIPNILEARAALDLDTSRRRHDQRNLLPRQDLGSLISIIVNGPPDETTTRSPSATTGRATTTTRPATSTTPTPSRTSTTPSPSSTSTTRSAEVVTSPPPTRPTSTVTQTSTQPLSTENADSNLASNANAKTGLPSVVIGVIVAASVIFGLIIIALIVRKFFQLRRRRRRGTWAHGSLIAPFEPPLKEKALPTPPPAPMAIDSQNRSYPAYPPTAVTFGNNAAPYSPVAPSSAGYPAPYAFGGNSAGVGTGTTTAAMFNQSAYTPNDLAGPIVITPPTPNITASAGTMSIVKRTFVPSLPDELSIANGDQVRVLAAYDDGWALCEKLTGGEKGVVPQECLESLQSSNSNAPQQQTVGSEDTRLNRNSSLRRGQDQTY